MEKTTDITKSPESSNPPKKEEQKPVLYVLIGVIVLLLVAITFLLGRMWGGGKGDVSGGTNGNADNSLVQPVNPPEETPVPDAPASEPTEVPHAEPTETTVVVRDAKPNGRLFVDGVETPCDYVGGDIVIQRSDMPDLCQVRWVAQEDDGSYSTAAVWFNYTYGNELSFLMEDYGGYVACNASGLGVPSRGFLHVLIWAYHDGFLRCINDQTTAKMHYSTERNTKAEESHIFSMENSRNTYDINDFQVREDENSIAYDGNGTILLNASFLSHATNRYNGNTADVYNHKTMEIIWEDGMWKVNRLAFLNDADFEAGRYADLP